MSADVVASARRLLFRADDILTGPAGLEVWHVMDGLVQEVVRLQVELAKPVAGPWWMLDEVACWRAAIAFGDDISVGKRGWRVQRGGEVLASGPETGEDGRRLADAAAVAAGWRLL